MPRRVPVIDPRIEREHQSLHRQVLALQLMMEHLGRRSSLRQSEVFWKIVQEEPVTRLEIFHAVKGSDNSIIADLLRLGSEGYRDNRGLELITWRWTMDSRPCKEYTLTARGIALAEEFGAILMGGTTAG